jgi:hypothetical protein
MQVFARGKSCAHAVSAEALLDFCQRAFDLIVKVYGDK